MEDLDRRGKPSGHGRHVVADAERVGRVEADPEVHDLLEEVLELRRRQVAMVFEGEPDAVILDIRMPPTFSDEGIVAAGRVRDTFPGKDLKVIFRQAPNE